MKVARRMDMDALWSGCDAIAIFHASGDSAECSVQCRKETNWIELRPHAK